MPTNAELQGHRDWIGALQPVGLVVSAPALFAAGAFVDRNVLAQRHALAALVKPPRMAGETEKQFEKRAALPVRFPDLAREVLGWKAGKLVGSGGGEGEALPESLDLVLPAFNETLRPTYAVRALKEDEGDWMMLVQEVGAGVSFDEAPKEGGKKWQASPQVRLERLLHEKGVAIGLLNNGRELRLVYAPRGESSGHVTWPLEKLREKLHEDGLSALCMLLGAPRLFTMAREQRLPQILRESRKYQSVVSTKLAGQVLEALNELLRGFQAANEAAKGKLLDATVREEPDHIYGGLLAVLLRLVFVLYAEERGMLSSDVTYVRNYSLVGLFDKLRADWGRFPDTMDLRYGAWSRLLVLFRMIHDGAKRGEMRLPPRYGHLFDPDGWGFLEGRGYGISRTVGERLDVPKVSDGVVLRVLEKLLLLESERLSYRALDVEQIGSVYENMMGFKVESAEEISIGVGKDHVVVGLESLLKKKGAEREKLLKEKADVELTGKAGEALKQAGSIDDLVAALGRRISPLTPRTVPAGGIYLQPTDERRRSGSHYTPRELTEPIVRTTLRPVLEDLGVSPKPDKILELKVCDPAMGSGAFLVEACRQLAEQLVKAYDEHGRPGDVPPDEDILLYAQRQVAQHCLYGVDKNPFAVDLGKLSLWLATLARDHAFTFLDHSIRHGDSLVGLSREQIASFHWEPEQQVPVIRTVVEKSIKEALALRQKIQDLANSDDVVEKRRLLSEADGAIGRVRLVGDCVVGCFFSEDKPKAREEARTPWETKIQFWLSGRGSSDDIEGFVEELRTGEAPVPCFHWDIEFPEVFRSKSDGFDVIVGNPPFAGKNNLLNGNRSGFLDWLKTLHDESHGNADLVAHFYRRAFTLLRARGTLGLIATNTIAQGDTRSTGLRWVCTHGGEIFEARRRVKWPGLAAVIVSVAHIKKGAFFGVRKLDGRDVPTITAFLFHGGGHENPTALHHNAGKSFIGSYILGMGFTFDDTNDDATPLVEMRRLIAKDSRNAERLFPYIGGEEVNTSPTHSHHRYAINFGELGEKDAREGWPDLMKIVEQKVKPDRLAQKREIRARYWWRFAETTPALWSGIHGLNRVIAVSRVGQYGLFAFLPSGIVYSEGLVIIASDSCSALATLQSRPHETWTRFFASSMKDDLRYTPSDCFETFPFPPNWDASRTLEAAGQAYYDYRAALMVRNNEGLTKTYNRFHDPDESSPEILKLRELHAAMDRAVLDAYGWTDLQPTCEFLLDYEETDDDAESAAGRRKKKPWRYRWPDEFRDEVLARLLELNAERAKAEAVSTAPPKPRARPKTAKPTAKTQRPLFDEEDK